jgi:HflK protein
MERNIQPIGMINWCALLAVGVISAILAHYCGAASGTVGVVFLTLGFLVAIVSYFQMRLEERERLEKLEFDELKKAKSASALFTEQADTFPARRSREQFEKIVIPIFTALLFLLQAGAVWWLWKWLGKASPPKLDAATMALALYALFALMLFLLGKYSSSLARLEGQRLLRPGAGYLMLGAFMSGLAAASEAAVLSDFPKVDVYVAYGLGVLLALMAVETLVGLVLELYRPRVRGQAARLLYESRLIGLFGQPGGLITTAAQALDYQFGFKVSETWIFKFLKEAVLLIILLQLGALFFSTTFVIIDPNEQGLLEHFGRQAGARATLEPGLHFKWPWPIDKVYRFQTRQIRSFIVGEVPDTDEAKERTVLWTKPHFKRAEGESAEAPGMLVASRSQTVQTNKNEKPVPANILTVSIPFQYQITNLVDWAYHHANSDQVLQKLANREVIRYLVNVDMDSIMSDHRLEAAEDIRRRVQAHANEVKLGVNIVFVGLQDIHPPLGNKQLQVAAAFEQVFSARQQKQTNILYWQAYAARTIPAAQAKATNIISEARNVAVSKVTLAEGESARFTNQMAAYRASPSVYTSRTYLETLAASLAPATKYVITATNTQDVLTLNLEEHISGDLLNSIIAPPDMNRASTNR